jgi:sortase (surface protein transpeptidase)
MTNQKMLQGGVVMYPDRLLNQDNFVLLEHHLGRKKLLFGLLEQAKEGMKVSVTYLNQIQDLYH